MLTDGVSIPAKMEEEKNIWFGKQLRGVVVVVVAKKRICNEMTENIYRGERISKIWKE